MNILGLVLQLFVVSRVVKRWGVELAIMILPILSFGACGTVLVYPTLVAVLSAKVLENSIDYSLNNTVWNMLYLPCTYEQKFTGKQVIDSFFVRMGDVVSALLVFAGTTMWALEPQAFALINGALVAIWLFLAWRVGGMYASLTRSGVAPITRAVRVATV